MHLARSACHIQSFEEQTNKTIVCIYEYSKMACKAKEMLTQQTVFKEMF